MDHQVVEVPVSALSVVGSPRTSGADPEHVEALAAMGEEFPPIIVHRATMQVIDGVHRLEVAKLQGRRTIAAKFFEGAPEDAFVLAVQSNAVHGLPLSLADRKRAAERIIRTHPQWSARRLAATVGVSPGTVAEIRRKMFGDPGEGDVRVGRDGKVRPINGAEGRRIATELIVEKPELSLRQIARAAGVSPETVRSLRNRLRRAESPAGAEPGWPGGTAPDGQSGPVDLAAGRGRRQDRAAVVQRLKADPALRLSVTGRDLLRLLNIHMIRTDEWESLIESVPPHCRGAVAQLARGCAEIWAEFATQVDGRIASTA
ncbi:streptomycin biosynthesis protein [Sphaerisporangium aureirubrum]|uniref:Streptomycin biosynthesis protein n=1 Tax=Sphaerisporangium aureirubrum TaxID=1544736 RepID=A0ABW1NGY7_9ACTN